MKNIRYVGPEDARELSAEDLRRLGVEDAEEGLRFERGQSTPVDDKVADVLMNHIVNLRESTDTELEREEADLEAELGFKLYDPNDHTAEEVKAELATSPENRRQYILRQERAGKDRKSVYDAVGANPEDYDEALNEDGEEAAEAMGQPIAAAGGPTSTSGATGGTPPVAGRASTA